MKQYLAAFTYSTYVLLIMTVIPPAIAQYEDLQVSKFYHIGGGLRVRVGDDNSNHPDTVYIQLLAWKAPLDKPATDEPITRGQCTIRFNSDTQELSITHKSGKRWAARLGALDAFGRAQVPGLEVAWRASENESLYGLGERFDALNVAGRKIDMWIVDEPGQGDGSASYFCTPVLYSSAGYGFFAFNNPEGEFDLNSRDDGWVRYKLAGDSIYFWVTFGPDVPSMIQTRADVMFGDDIIGLGSVPNWAYAPWISRNSYENQREAEDAMDGMQERDLPFGVIVLEAWKGPSETGEFNRFDKTRWPDVKGFFARCKRENVKVVLWQVPILHPSSPWFARAEEEGYLVRDPEGNVSLREEWLAGFANIDFTNDRAAEFYKEMLRPVVALGVSGFKADDGEAIKPTDVLSNGRRGWDAHNLYSALYNQATFEVLGGNGMIWARSGSLGIEQAPALWAGDQGAQWDHLRRLIPAGLSTGISGMPYWGHDIGGYYGTCTPELYIRWLQFGALSPFMQFHGIEPREPWHFGEEAVEAYRRLALLREAIRPTLEALGREAAKTGMPIMWPMFFVTGEYEAAGHAPDQYMLGEDLLVAPVLEEGATGRVVRFPAGRWRHALSRTAYEGPAAYSVPIGLDSAPLFIRGGVKLEAESLDVRLPGDEDNHAMLLWNVQAPLRGELDGRSTLLRFAVKHLQGRGLYARWHFEDTPDQIVETPVMVTSEGAGRVDLTPQDMASVIGRRQVYEVYETDNNDPSNRLLRGVVDWRDLIRVEIDDPHLRVVTDQARVTGRMTNRMAHSAEVEVQLSLPRGMSTTRPEKHKYQLDAAQSRAFEFSFPIQAPEDYVGDVRARVTARSGGVTCDSAEAALICSPRWLVAGPFPAPSKAEAFAATTPAEWTFDAQARFRTSAGIVRWEAVDPQAVAEMNGLDFNRLFGPHSNTSAYATALIRSDRNQRVQLRLGSDDTLTVRVNGKRLYAQSHDRAALPDQNIIEADFNEGVNRVLVKVAQGEHGWGMVFRITDPQGGAVTGLTDALVNVSAYDQDRAGEGSMVETGHVLKWRVLGPFVYDAGAGVAGQPHIEKALNANSPLPQRVGGQVWRDLESGETNGWIDLKHLSSDSHLFVYCATEFELARPTEVEFRCGSDDGLVLWVDGMRVVESEVPRAYEPGQDVVRVKLDAGTHRTVTRVSQGAGDWGFDIRLWDVGEDPPVPLGADRR